MVLVIVLSSALAVTVKAQSTDPSLTLYAGELPSGTYGYGDSSNTLASPGPTLTLTEGTSYTMTVYNVGTMPHAWEITSSKTVSSSPMFGAGIDISSYISPGASGKVTFTPNQAGNFYYVCTVPGHIALGMWGNVVVQSSSVPEFPSAFMLMFTALTMTALAAFLAKRQTKIKGFF
jgi:uncharacterized cupredoxin-like copper-binding protein